MDDNETKLIGFDGPRSLDARADALRPFISKTRMAGANASKSAVFRYAMDTGLSKLEREAKRDGET